MALSSLPRFLIVLVLAAAAMMQAATTTTTSSAVDVCTNSGLACAEDTVCSACRETASSNTDGFEQCIANYVYSASICTNQAAQACCQAEASSTDCLANEFYVAYYDCRLVNDVVGEECTGLSCAAVGTPGPTPVGGVVDPTMSATVVDDDLTVTDADWAARTVPLGVKNTAVAAVFATAGLLVALPGALV
ncbi:unnamed protein product [Ectocarpus sp. CCAP 1310/34]|nr:unnamed protein product [Ectocarpus sp. CCAP 1310/34]